VSYDHGMVRRFVVLISLVAAACTHETARTNADDADGFVSTIEVRDDAVAVHAAPMVTMLAPADVSRSAPPPSAEALAALGRELAAARADEEAAKKDLERQRQLYAACGVKKDLDQAVANLEGVTAHRKAIAARLASLRRGPG
jgi:hypothetical protein